LHPRINNAGFHDDQYTALVDSAEAEADAAKRKMIYSQINDYILDQSFGWPIAPTTDRVVTKASVHDVGMGFNNVMRVENTWMG
jgi:ABC-type transport system substrate-binding protein